MKQVFRREVGEAQPSPPLNEKLLLEMQRKTLNVVEFSKLFSVRT